MIGEVNDFELGSALIVMKKLEAAYNIPVKQNSTDLLEGYTHWMGGGGGGGGATLC